VLPGDTVESLHSRIQIAEHSLYPVVVEAFVQGRLTVDGRDVAWG
jgi:folate-dependent phosphoribosylglycinamide formyltransferase PurN